MQNQGVFPVGSFKHRDWWGHMKKILLRVAAGIVVLLLVALVIIFFSLNSIAKKSVNTIGPRITKVETRLGSAVLSPFSGKGELHDLFVGNPEGFKAPSAIQVGVIKVDLKLGSVLKKTV